MNKSENTTKLNQTDKSATNGKFGGFKSFDEMVDWIIEKNRELYIRLASGQHDSSD